MRFMKSMSSTEVLLSSALLLVWFVGAQASVVPAHNATERSVRHNKHGWPRSNERIIGGIESAQGDFPSAVSLQIITGNGLGFCGGTLITTSAVATAAHCVYDFAQGKAVDAHNIRVGYGSISRAKQTLVTAQRVDVNPDFDPRDTVNDIAIVSIDPIILVPGSVEVAPIYSGKLPQGTQLTAVGWGLTTADGSAGGLPDTLQQTQIIVGSKANCSRFIPGYESSNGPQICTENFLRPGTDTCQGDSGTGVYRVVDGKPFLAGLTSYGANLQGDPTCALDDGFAIYTHVAYFRSFIDSVVGEVLRRRQVHKHAARRAEARDGTYYPSADGANYPPTGTIYPSADGTYYPSTSNTHHPPADGTYYPSIDNTYYPSVDGAYYPTAGNTYYPSTGNSYPSVSNTYPSVDNTYYPSSESAYPPVGNSYHPSAGNTYPPVANSYYPSAGNDYPPAGNTYYSSTDDTYVSDHKDTYTSGYPEKHKSEYDNSDYDDEYSNTSEEPEPEHRHHHHHHHRHHHHGHRRRHSVAPPTTAAPTAWTAPYPVGGGW